MLAEPLSAGNRPVSMRMVVVLPAPLSPSKAKMAPLGMASVR